MILNWIKKITRIESFKKITYTTGIIGIYMLLCHIPLPFLDTSLIYLNTPKTQEIFTMFLGSGVEKFSFMALGIMPYTTSSIIMQLLSSNALGIDTFKTLKNNYNTGITQLNNWTKRLTILIAMIHGSYSVLNLLNLIVSGFVLVPEHRMIFGFMGVVLMMAGSLIAVWLSNLISKNGVGNGMSVIIFVNILSNSYSHFNDIFDYFMSSIISWSDIFLIILFNLVLFIIIIFTDDCYYKIKVQNLGSQYENNQEYLRIKINNAGIMPIIIASYLSYIPQIIEVIIRSTKLFFIENLTYLVSFITPNSFSYFVFISIIIVLVSMNYSEVSLDPKEISRQIQQNNVALISKYKNIRPGKDTEIYIKSIIYHLPSALIVTFIFIGSQIFCNLFNIAHYKYILNVSGISIMLAVTTAKSIFNTAISNNYDYITNKYKCHDNQSVNDKIDESNMRNIEENSSKDL